MVRPWKAGNYRLPKLSLITYTSELPCTRFNPFGNVPVRSGYIYIYTCRLVQACRPKFVQHPMVTPVFGDGPWNFARMLCACSMSSSTQPLLTNVFFLLVFPARYIYYFTLFFLLDIWVYGDPNYRGKIGEIRQRLRRGWSRLPNFRVYLQKTVLKFGPLCGKPA